MKTKLSIRFASIALAMATLSMTVAQAATVTANKLGDGGWYSSDTRDANGTTLFGQNDTHPALNALNGGAVPGDDAKIDQQISFVTGPAGSTGSLGSLKLNATDQNAGKAHVSYLDATTGIAPATDLLDPKFGVKYRYYNEPMPTSRTLGASISLTDNDNQDSRYSLSYVGTSVANDWTVNSADHTSGWKLYGTGDLGNAPGGSGSVKSLDDWAIDPTFGGLLTNDFTVYEVGFNLGSYQRNNNTYVDWFQYTFPGDINNGVDFQAVPEPTAFALAGLGLCGLATLRRRRRA